MYWGDQCCILIDTENDAMVSYDFAYKKGNYGIISYVTSRHQC